MQIIVKDKSKRSIEVGDLVAYDDKICLVVEDRNPLSMPQPEFPYSLVDIHTGRKVNAFKTMNGVTYNTKELLAKNDDIELHY